MMLPTSSHHPDDEEGLHGGGGRPPQGALATCIPASNEKYKKESRGGAGGVVTCIGVSFVAFITAVVLIVVVITLRKVDQSYKITVDYLGCVAGSAKAPSGDCIACPPGCAACAVVPAASGSSSGSYTTQCTPCAPGYWFSLSAAAGATTGQCVRCTETCPLGTWALSACKATQDRVCTLPGAGLPAPLGSSTWDDVVKMARGTTVNFGMWDDDASINAYVKSVLWTRLLEAYDISLQVVSLKAGTNTGVERIAVAARAGSPTPIDMIWINGNNYRNMSQLGLLYGPWADRVPNGLLYNWSSPLINEDFQYPNNGYEMPYNVAQFIFVYNNAKIPDASRPRTIRDLITWIKQNPGRFAVPVPADGNFEASAFVRHIFYEYCGYSDFKGAFNQALYNQRAPLLWQVLQEIQPYLYLEYDAATDTTRPPKGSARMAELFGDGTLWMTYAYNTFEAAGMVESGDWPTTTRSYVLDSKTLTNTNFVAVVGGNTYPALARNLAGALVAANEIASMQQQFVRAQPAFFGSFQAYDPTRAGANWTSWFNQISAIKSLHTPDYASLIPRQVGELDSKYDTQIANDWKTQVRGWSIPGNGTYRYPPPSP